MEKETPIKYQQKTMERKILFNDKVMVRGRQRQQTTGWQNSSRGECACHTLLTSRVQFLEPMLRRKARTDFKVVL